MVIAGQDAPTVEAGYTLQGLYNIGTTVSAMKGSVRITGVIPAVWDAGWLGKKVDINGNRYELASLVTAGDGATIAPQYDLTEQFKETTASGLPYGIYTGLMDWEKPPSYRYAYYNPTTGHCTNPSPVTEITEKDVVGRTVQITGIPTSSAAYNNGYTEDLDAASCGRKHLYHA